MNLHAEEVPCPCPWCEHNGQKATGHRLVRYWFDATPPSPEAKAMMDEIVRKAVESASSRT